MSESRGDSDGHGLAGSLVRLRPLTAIWNRTPLSSITGEATAGHAYLLVIGAVFIAATPYWATPVNIVFWLAGIFAVLTLPVSHLLNRLDVDLGVVSGSPWTLYLPLLGVGMLASVPVFSSGVLIPIPFDYLGGVLPRVELPLLAVVGVLALVAQPLATQWNRRYPGGYFGRVSGWQLFVLVLGVLFVLWAPYFRTGMNRALGLAGIWAIFAMSWDIQSGYTGYISFGHSALSGAAGYTVGLATMHADGLAGYFPIGSPTDVWTVVPLAIVITLGLGLFIGALTLRLRGPYFSLITLVAVLLFTRLIIGFNEYTNGLNPIGPPHGLQAYTFDPFARYYFVILPLVLVAFGLVAIARSNVGLILTVIRENEPAVASAGLSPTRFKLWSFAISSIPMAIGGVLLAYFDGRVDPATFVVVTNSIEMIAIAVIGGLSSVLGPFFAAFAFIPLEESVLPNFFEPGVRGLMLWSIVLFILVFARDGIFRLFWHALGRVGGGEE